MDKKALWAALVLIVVILLGWYLLSNRQQVVDTGKDTVRIGIIGPFTGPLAEYGEAHRNGFLLAADDFKIADKHVEFIFEDSQYDTAKAVSAFRKLTTIDKVDLVVDWGAATSYGLAPLAKDAGVPFIAISVDPDTVKASNYVIRHNYSPDDNAEELWKYFRSKGYKNIGIVKMELLYFNKIADSLQKLKAEDETVTIVDNYASFSDKDFRTSIAKIKSGNQYDALGVFLAGGQIAEFYKQANDQALSLPTFGTDFFESHTEIAAAGGLMDGAVYVNMGASDDFAKTYKSRFGNDNQVSYAGLSYDLGGILATQINYSSAESILSSLADIKSYRGTIGSYTYNDENGDRYLKPNLYVKEIQGNTINVLK